MIGKITMGRSFAGCIRYLLEDKKVMHAHQPSVKNRAEVLLTNYCCGSRGELVEQFRDVRGLNPRVEKPVLHISLSLSPEDHLEPHQFISLVRDLAQEMNFEKHQYLAVRHTDTAHPHVHILVNRVGLDGKTLKDSNNYRQLASCCRKLEVRYGLKRVLSPRRFLPQELRFLPRRDTRKETLAGHIHRILSTCTSYEAFQSQMSALGYTVLKGRGFAFIDPGGVKTKGSEVGYSLGKIERALRQNLGRGLSPSSPKENLNTPEGPAGVRPNSGQEKRQAEVPGSDRKITAEKILDKLLTPKEEQQALSQEGANDLLKKKKKKRRHLHP